MKIFAINLILMQREQKSTKVNKNLQKLAKKVKKSIVNILEWKWVLHIFVGFIQVDIHIGWLGEILQQRTNIDNISKLTNVYKHM